MRTSLSPIAIVLLAGCAAGPAPHAFPDARAITGLAEPRDGRAEDAMRPAAVMPRATTRTLTHALDLLAVRMRIHAHNLANVHTVGFKKWRLRVAEAQGSPMQAAGLRKDATGTAAPTGLQIGAVAHLAGTTRDYSPGVLEASSRALDIAIDGPGFFQVQLPDATIGYTRDGQLSINAAGKLVTAAGNVLQPEVNLTSDVIDVSIDGEGRVTVRTQGSNTVSQISQIQLARFVNPVGLLSIGDNVLKETDASGPPLTGNAGSNGLGSPRQGFIERSNVEVEKELFLLHEAERQYEMLWLLRWRNFGKGGNEIKSPADLIIGRELHTTTNRR